MIRKFHRLVCSESLPAFGCRGGGELRSSSRLRFSHWETDWVALKQTHNLKVVVACAVYAEKRKFRGSQGVIRKRADYAVTGGRFWRYTERSLCAVEDGVISSKDHGRRLTLEESLGNSVEGTGSSVGDVFGIEVRELGHNTRRILARICIRAPLEAVWRLLTDYDNLSDYIPSLAVNEVLERKDSGARLLQVGEQKFPLGVKFTARAVVEVEEYQLEVSTDVIKRDLSFEMVEGDFQLFRGLWRMEQVKGNLSLKEQTLSGTELRTLLSYIVDVQPKLWLPVALVEGILTKEIRRNLLSVQNKAINS